MKKVLSAIQPTGELHLGNYFGAIQNWINIQEKYDCNYGIVDYHALTMPSKANKLRQNTWNLAFQLLACGVNIDNLFVQSLVPEHTELSWILGSVCSYGELTRMTQFKDKSQLLSEKQKDSFVSSALLFYPVLQAADILIYHADYVPVGKDQVQHLELTRNIANRFNHLYGKAYFKEPEPLFSETPKVQSLADPSRKMSKSLGEKHYISLTSDEARIRKQVKSAVTDTGDTPTGEISAGVKNLFDLLKASGDHTSHAALLEDYHEDRLKYSDLKEHVANSLVKLILPIQERYQEILSNKKEIKYQILNSSAEIRKEAKKTLKEVREIVGLLNLKE